MPQPSVYTTKTGFLSKQVRQLSALPPPPPKWRESLPPADEHGDLTDAVLHQVLYKLSVVAKRHSSIVYNAQTTRHIAEQIDSLYRDGTGAAVEEQTEVLRAGVELRDKGNIDALPESYPREKGEDEEELERYQVLRARLVRGCEVLEGQRRKRDYYGRLRDLAKPFGNPVENVQPNLVTKDGKLHGELERTRMLAVRLAAEVESAGERGFGKKEEGEEEEVDVDMDDDAEEEEWRRKVAGLLEGMS